MAAKEHSFDISAKADIQEFKNALEQAKKEIANLWLHFAKRCCD